MAKIVELFIGKICIAHENFSLTFKFSFTEIAAGKSKLIEFASVKRYKEHFSPLIFFIQTFFEIHIKKQFYFGEISEAYHCRYVFLLFPFIWH